MSSFISVSDLECQARGFLKRFPGMSCHCVSVHENKWLVVHVTSTKSVDYDAFSDAYDEVARYIREMWCARIVCTIMKSSVHPEYEYARGIWLPIAPERIATDFERFFPKKR